jgi:Cu/Ag efflux pump CusA
MAMPLEFHAEIHSDTLRQQGQFWRVGGAILAVAIAVYLLLQAAFGSWRLATLTFLTMPLTLVGGVLTAGLVGGVRVLGALMGLLAVFGIAARSTVLLIRSFRRETPPNAEWVNAVTRDRVPSIVLSALAIVAAILPLLFLGRVAGTEALFPFAVVVIGGLVTTTLFTVLVVPSLYLRFAHGAGPSTPKPVAGGPTPQPAEGAL